MMRQVAGIGTIGRAGMRAAVAALVAAAIAVLALGCAVPTAHAATAHMPQTCSGTAIQPGAISNIDGWLGITPMTVKLTGRTSGCTYSDIVIDSSGTITNLPASMVPDTYDVVTTNESVTFVCTSGYVGVAFCGLSGSTFVLNTNGSDSIDGSISCSGALYRISGRGAAVVPVTIGPVPIDGSGGATATPELSSGELLATGVVPIFGLWLYRRRRRGGR